MKWLDEFIMPKWLRFLLMVVLPLAILVGIIYFIYHSGELAERDRNVAAENAKLVQYGELISKLQAKARDDERAHVIKVNNLTTNYEKRNDDAQTKTKSVLRDVAAGTRQLRIATKNSTQACRDTTAKAGTPAPAIAESAAELSNTAAGFLINLTGECDATAEKLNLCIDIAESDRRLTTSQISSEMTTSIALTNKENDK